MTATAIVGAPPGATAPSAHHRPRQRRLVRWFVVASAVLVLAGAGVGLRYALTQRTAPPRWVEAEASRGRVSAKVSANGTLSALVTVTVGSQTSGRIAWLGADFGSRVKKGEPIATIDPALLHAAAAQTWANLVAARSNAERADALLVQAERARERAVQLREGGVLSQANLEAAEADLAVAKATRRSVDADIARAAAANDQATLNLGYTTIVSPIDGVVISRNVDVGQTVAATLQSPTLFTIAHDLAEMQIDTNVAEADIGKIAAGMPVSFTVDAYPTRTFQGTLRQVRDAAQTIQNVVTYDAVIDIENAEHLLKPGMTANVTFVFATREDALLVPNAALRFRPDDAGSARDKAAAGRRALERDERVLWTAGPDGTPTSVVVRVGLTDGGSTEILAGVEAGTRVLVEAVRAEATPR